MSGPAVLRFAAFDRSVVLVGDEFFGLDAEGFTSAAKRLRRYASVGGFFLHVLGRNRPATKRIRQKFRALDDTFDSIKNYSGYGYYWDHGE